MISTPAVAAGYPEPLNRQSGAQFYRIGAIHEPPDANSAGLRAAVYAMPGREAAPNRTIIPRHCS